MTSNYLSMSSMLATEKRSSLFLKTVRLNTINFRALSLGNMTLDDDKTQPSVKVRNRNKLERLSPFNFFLVSLIFVVRAVAYPRSMSQ